MIRIGPRSALTTIAILVVGALLFRPPGEPAVQYPTTATSFRWDANSLFTELEALYKRAARGEPEAIAEPFAHLMDETDDLLARISGAPARSDRDLARLVVIQFDLATLAAAFPERLPDVLDQFTRIRRTVMTAAIRWPSNRSTHEVLYRIVHGGRIALDEALTQTGFVALPPLVRIEEIPSATPSVVVQGVRVHSGDILLSRGGAPTSALIARGNDFPNIFSHVALAHVDQETGEGSVIESLIEAGSVLSTVDEYLESKKHRIVVLRMRPDHPALLNDPMLPHRAAQSMLNRIRSGGIPYDFAMDWQDPGAMFCSEVVYHAYAAQGVELWSIRSSMSTPGLTRWLAGMGVRNFTSLVPSDLEMDTQVRAVVEWWNAPELMEYRLDNAIIDVLLEEAERGGGLGYRWISLPLARLVKIYSIGQSSVGIRPTIPAGMAPSTALEVRSLVSTIHPALKQDLIARTVTYRETKGFEPPYWALVDLARESIQALKPDLAPALSTPNS